MSISMIRMAAAAVALTALFVSTSANAAVFNVGNTADAGSFGTVTGQGFSVVATAGAPGSATGDTVYLSQFQFFKGAAGAANAGNIFAVVFNTAYPDLSTAVTAAAATVGTSTNSISSATMFASGDALTFDFADLPLIYGNTYSVGLFTGVPSSATAAQISALTANYSETTPGSGVYVPTTNYGGPDNYQAAAYFGVSGGFYGAYSGAGDTNFFATLSTTVPEPTALAGLGLLATFAGRRRRATTVPSRHRE